MKIMKIKDFLYGLLLGSSVLAPGLSIATLALVLGIYERLLDAVSDFFSPRFKTALPFLLPFGIGALISIGISSRAIALAYDNFPIQTYAFFLGLIAASVPLLWKTTEAKSNFKRPQYVVLLVTAAAIASLRFLNPAESDYVIEFSLTVAESARLFATGAITTAAMLLPGLSGALVLMLLGTHSMLTHAISELNLAVIGITALGGMIGLVAFSKLIKYLMSKYSVMVNAVSIGMVIGSIAVVFPALSFGLWETITSLLLFAIGYSLVFLLERKK